MLCTLVAGEASTITKSMATLFLSLYYNYMYILITLTLPKPRVLHASHENIRGEISTYYLYKFNLAGLKMCVSRQLG